MVQQSQAGRYSDHFFSNKEMFRELGKRTARGGAITVSAQGIRFVLQTGSTIILARLLTPDDFGLVGMVTVLTLLCYFFRDFGLTLATVQRPHITRQQISNLFWFNVVVSIGIALIFSACAPLISFFYSQPKLTPIVLVISVSIFIESIGLQHRALMMRVMQFSRIAAVEIGSQLIAVCTAVYMGWAGYGYWALVALYVSGSFFRSLFYCLSTRWLPQRPRRHAGTKPFITYGGNLFGFNIVNYFSRNADNILIGKFAGAQQLGYYSAAYQLIRLPMQQINNPLFQAFLPTLSRLTHNPEAYRTTYIKLLSLLAYISIPIVFYIALNRHEIVLILLGAKWESTATLLLALLPLAYMNATNIADGIVYSSLGTTYRQFKWYMFVAPVTVLCMAVGLPWGALGVALGASASYVLIRPFSIAYCYKGTPLRCTDFYLVIGRPTGLALTGALFAYLGKFLLSEYTNIESPIIALALKSIVYGLIIIGVDHVLPGNIRLHFLLKESIQRLTARKNSL